jgi:hypothetical protein
MIRVSVRNALAAAGVVLLAAAAFSVRATGAQPAGWLLAIGGLTLLLPVTLRTSYGDLEIIEERLVRFRTAALLCFTFATAIWVALMTLGNPRGQLASDLASLGTAFWLVSMLMLLFVVVLASRRRALLSR